MTRSAAQVSPYPWDEWLDGSHWVLEQSEDFPNSKVVQFRKTAGENARNRGLRLRSSRLGPTTLVIRAEAADGA